MNDKIDVSKLYVNCGEVKDFSLPVKNKVKVVSLAINVDEVVSTLNRLGALTDKMPLEDVKTIIMNNVSVGCEER